MTATRALSGTTMESCSTTWIVTRHPGASDFIHDLGYRGVSAPHLDIEKVCAGDTVVGVIPLMMAEKLASMCAHVLHLCVELTPADRGKELSANRLRELNAELRFVTVTSKNREGDTHET
jgi:CRISPR-associated protein Csx16